MNSILTITQLNGARAGRTIVVRQSQLGADGPTANSAVVTASENLSTGDLVNVYDSGGLLRMRRASAATDGKECNGFVLASVLSEQAGTVYFAGRNDQQAGLTPGRAFLGVVDGRAQSTAPTGAGEVVQPVGYALSATTLVLQLGPPVRLS